jgi:alpha-mannosidase
MHDEATVPFYEAMENIELGFHFLKDTFGKTPHIGWAIDTFGYSAYTPALLNKYNIDTVFVSRIGEINKNYTINELHLMNFVWEGHPIGKGDNS